MKFRCGFPVVNADNIFKVLKKRGITIWPQVQPTMSLENYLKGQLTPQQLDEARRFAPKTEVIFLKNPDRNLFTGFRSLGKNWASVFAFIEDDLLPIVGEYKHGADCVSIGFPSGVSNKREPEMATVGKREFLEEIGVKLEEVILLSGPEGIPVSGRQSTQRFFPYLGILNQGSISPKPKLDPTEFLQVVLMPLREWLKLIERGKVTESSSITLTFLALRYLERMKIR